MAPARRTTKRKMKGRDWHGWAFFADFEDGKPMSFCHWAEPHKPKNRPTPLGRWVRVKFVPVDPQTTMRRTR